MTSSNEPIPSLGIPGSKRDRPYRATLFNQRPLTSPQSSKDVRHVLIDLGDSGISYEPGDCLGIWIDNDPGLAAEICALCHLSPEEEVIVDAHPMSLDTALREQFELTQLHPGFIKHYVELCQNPALHELTDNTQALRKYIEHRQVAEVLHQFPCTLTAQQLLSCLRRLTPRQYSISSSQRWNETHAAALAIHGEISQGEQPATSASSAAEHIAPSSVANTAGKNLVALTVRMVRYQDGDQERKGAGSSFLGWRLQPGNQLSVYVIPNPNFRLPQAADKPVIMIGPGTGIAPFRAFLQERAATGATGKNWLFFGNASRQHDFLYQTELNGWLQTGVLTRLDTAFSRDQEERIHVQHRMLAEAAALYEWLQQGAHLYVCGDARHMAEDVQKTLLLIIEQQGGVDAATARQMLVKMRQEKRYQRDVY
jgi:sulfite reductase (NADPH) flavoprotein alpha-component